MDDDEPIPFELTDELDLHYFAPADVGALVRDWLDAAAERGATSLRLVHGKGLGVQREQVRRILAADSRVASFRDASLERGGWGATLVDLHPRC